MSKSEYKPAEELRRLAEKRLQKQTQRGTDPETMPELQRIVHELAVHQIELEMQNDELQQARAELESLLVQYTDLYDFAPVGYFTLNKSGLILKLNLTGARMLDVNRSQLINQKFTRFITADSRLLFTAFLEKVFDGHSQETAVIGLQKEAGEKIIVRIEASAREDEQECLTALIDITAQTKAQDLLRESEHKYRALFDNMAQGAMLCRQDNKVISANPAAEHILGLTLDEMQAKPLPNLYPRAIHEDGTDFSEETHPAMTALRMGKTMHNVAMGVWSNRKNHYIWLNITAVPLSMPDENRLGHALVTFEDITYRKRMVMYNKLTVREKVVFKLLAKNLSRKIISEYLNISPKTVDKHRENLMEKLNLQEKEDLIQFAKLIGIV